LYDASPCHVEGMQQSSCIELVVRRVVQRTPGQIETVKFGLDTATEARFPPNVTQGPCVLIDDIDAGNKQEKYASDRRS